jgi:hypothetical protein
MTDDTQIEPNEPVAEAASAAETAQADEPIGTCTPMQDSAIAQGHLARLVLKRGGVETDIDFPINPPAVIGRFDPAVGPVDIDLGQLDPEGSYISRKHAKIDCDENGWSIADLGSSNGTFLLRSDFERVEEAELPDKQEIALGNARFVFHLLHCEGD